MTPEMALTQSCVRRRVRGLYAEIDYKQLARDRTRLKAAMGTRLRELREARGLSPAAVAAATDLGGLHERAITEIEAGERDAGFVQIVELLRIYGEQEEHFRRDIEAGGGASAGVAPP